MIRKGIATFNIGLNQDAEDRSLQVGEYREALNVTPGESDASTETAMPNELGNTQVSYTLSSGTNKCIGTVENKEDNSIIYFIYNSNNNHRILEYRIEQNDIVAILEPRTGFGNTLTTDFLNFKSNESIHSANVFDGNLTWVSALNPPRHLEIERAKQHLETYVGVTPISSSFFPYANLIRTGTADEKEQFIEAIKRPPIYEPTFVYATDSNRKANELRGKLWQFRYRYVYSDYSRSVFSPISKISLPENEETGIGIFNSSTSQVANNRLDITVDTGHPNVVSIEIAFRSGNTGTWYLIDNYIEKYNQNNVEQIASFTDYVFQWYGENAGRALADSEITPNFDAVPLIAKTQEYLHPNRIAYGNYKWGYDNVDLDVTLGITDSVYSTNRVKLRESLAHTAVIPGVDYFGIYTTHFVFPDNISKVPDGTIISGIVQVSKNTDFSDPLSYSWSYTKVSSDTSISVLRDSIYDVLSRVVPTTQITKTSISGRTSIQISSVTNFNYKWLTLNVGAPVSKRVSWKKGATHNFGIQYSDKQGRVSTVNIDNNMSIYVPFLTEDATYQGSVLQDNGNIDYGISVTIAHEPPDWAENYQIVYGGSNVTKYIQGCIGYGFVKEAYTIEGQFQKSVIALRIDEFLSSVSSPKNINYEYNYDEGDRIRFITNNDGEILSTYTDIEVLGFNPSSNHLIVEQFDLDFVPELFEIYNTTTDLKPLQYQEIGECYAIENGLHKSKGTVDEPDQTVSTPAIIHLNRGQTYLIEHSFDTFAYIQRLDSNEIVIIKDNTRLRHYAIEHPSWSFYYESESVDGGRVNLVAKNARQQWYSHHWIYGGRYLEGSKLNQVFSFDLANDQKVNVNDGEIQRLMEVGFTLKILQDRKLTSAYIGQRVLFNANKEQQIISTDSVVGDLLPANHSYGTQHPESVVRWNRYMYFFDARNGKYLRDANNGVIPISDYGMKSYFKNLADQVEEQGAMVLSTVNERNGLVTVSALTTKTNTLTFHESPVEGRSAWKSFHSYKPERFGFNGAALVSFKDGALWLHNSNSTRCNFYGVQEKYNVRFLINLEPESIKAFLSLWVNSNVVWSAPNKGDVKSGSQETRILEAKFKYEEGVYACEIPRDMNTPNMTELQGLINGDAIRGHILDVKLEGDKTTEVILRSVIVNYLKSQITV